MALFILYLLVLLAVAFLIEGAANALKAHKEVNQCVQCDGSVSDC